VVAAVSFLPSGDKQLLHTEGRFHLLGHLLAFAATGFLLALSMGPAWRRLGVLTIGSGLGASIEYAQHRIYGFRLELLDVLVDIVGVAIGVLLAAAVEDFTEP